MDNLEKYIRNQRQDLDSNVPTDELWHKIEAQLNQQAPTTIPKMIPLRRVWLMAASFTAILAAALTLQWAYLSRSTQNPQHSQQANLLNIENLNPEFVEAEQFYFQQISEKQKLIKTYKNPDQAELNAYLTELDTAYQDLKQELQQHPNEQIVGELIENLQIRIELLNKQIEVLQKIESLQRELKQQNSNNKTKPKQI